MSRSEDTTQNQQSAKNGTPVPTPATAVPADEQTLQSDSTPKRRRADDNTLWGRAFHPAVFALAAGLIVHFILYSNSLMSPAAIRSGDIHIGGAWGMQQGEWGLPLVEYLRFGLFPHAFVSALAILFFAVAGAIMTVAIRIENRKKQCAAAAIFACSPMVAHVLSIPYCSDAFGLSALFAASAAYCAFFHRNRYLGVGLAILFTALSMSINLSAVGMYLATVVGYFLIQLLRFPDYLKRRFLIDLFKGLLSLAAGFAVYYCVMRLMQARYNVPDGSGIALFQSFEQSATTAYERFSRFFTGANIAKNAYGEMYVYAALAATALLCVILAFGRLVKLTRPGAMFLIVVLLAILPLCANAFGLVVPDSGMNLALTSGMMVTAPILITICGWSDGLEPQLERGVWLSLQKWLSRLAIVLGFLLLWTYALTDQNDSSVMIGNKDQTVQLANRIWTTMESDHDFDAGKTPFLLAGVPSLSGSPLFTKANAYAKWGLVWNSFDGSTHTWNQVFKRYLGVNYKLCPVDEFRRIAKTDEFKNMPLYPARGSSKMIDGTYVVKLADISSWK